MELYGRVAQLGEHLLCKHVFISPKSLNRRLLTVQNPLLVGLLIGLHELKGPLSNFGQTLLKNGSIRVDTAVIYGGPDARESIRAVAFRVAREVYCSRRSIALTAPRAPRSSPFG
jgi:hypothetical protein